MILFLIIWSFLINFDSNKLKLQFSIVVVLILLSKLLIFRFLLKYFNKLKLIKISDYFGNNWADTNINSVIYKYSKKHGIKWRLV